MAKQDSAFYPAESSSRFAQLWGNDLEEVGYVQIPWALVKYQSELDLEPNEMVYLMNIIYHYRKPGQMPFPSAATIGARIGYGKDWVHKIAKRLADKGVIELIMRPGRSYAISLDPLVKKLSNINASQTSGQPRAALALIDFDAVDGDDDDFTLGEPMIVRPQVSNDPSQGVMIVRPQVSNDPSQHEVDKQVDQSEVDTLPEIAAADEEPAPAKRTRKKKTKPPTTTEGLILPGDDATRATIKAVLEELWQLGEWDYNLQLDIKTVLEVMSYDGVDPLEVAKELVIAGGAHPRTGVPYKNPRATFLNWCKLRMKWAKERKGNNAASWRNGNTRTAYEKSTEVADWLDDDLRSRRRRAQGDEEA